MKCLVFFKHIQTAFFFLFLRDWCVGFRHIEALADTVVFENKMNS